MKFIEFKENIDLISGHSSGLGMDSDRSEKLEIILDIVKNINHSLILKDVLELVLKHAIDLSKSDRGFIVLKNEQGKLEYNMGLNGEGKKLPKSLFEVSMSVVEDVFVNGESIFIENAQSDRGEDTSQSIVKLQLETILCAPLITGEKKIGVIYVDSKKLRKIKAREITDTFEILAGQAATAIKNAQLYNGQLKAYKALQDANQQLRIAKEKAELSDRLKSEFLAQISHEIRTPLNTILSFTSLLKAELKENMNSDLMQTFDIIDTGGRRLSRTIDSVLNMALLQTGNYDINFISVNLDKDILNKVVLELKVAADTSNIELNYFMECQNPIISGDYYTLEQIFMNIIDNAIKYTNEGKVDVILYDEDNCLCVDVVDTGIGISDEYLNEIFNPFSQEDTGYTRKYEGNGLGLALVKKYIELNNGEIVIQSKKGFGSKFKIKFPKPEK